MAKIVTQPKEEDLHQDDVMCLAVIKGQIFSGSYDGCIKKWSSNLKLLESWQAHIYSVYALAGNSKSLFSSSSSGEVKEWDPESRRQKNAILMESPTDKKTGEVKSLFLFRDLLFAGDDKGILTIWRPNFEIEAQKYTYVDIWGLAVSPDGLNVFVAKDNECIVSDFSEKFSKEMFATTLSVRATISGRAPIVVDEKHVLIIDRSGMNIQVHTNGIGKFPLERTLKEGHDMIINAMLLSGEIAITSGWDGKLIMWNITTGNKMAELQWENYVNTMAWLNENKRIVVVGGKSGHMIIAQF